MTTPSGSESLAETIPAAVAASIAAAPDLEAVIEPERRTTYAALGELVDRSARAMIAAAVGPGDRIAIWAPNGLGWIVAALGAHCAGAAIVPINTRFKGEEAAYLLSASKATTLITTVGFLDTDPVAMLRTAETPTPALQRIVLLEGSRPTAEAPAGVEVEAWQGFVERAQQVSDATAATRRANLQPTDPSDVLFTSGTTGRPKGVVMTHGQTVRQFREWCDFAGLRPADRYLIVNPFFHMFGYKAGWLASLLRGATIVPVAVFDVPAVLALVETERITVLPGAPTVYRSILDYADRNRFDLGSLRVAVTGAADIPVALIEEMRAELPFQTILTGYGLTEAGTCTGTRPDDDAETIATTAGRAMPGLEIIVAGPDDSEAPRGTTGELLVRGYSVMQGYLDDSEATAAAIDERGYLHTGDLATMDERGYVRIVGSQERHVDRRRLQCVPGRGRECPSGARRDRAGRRHRSARRAHGRGRRGLRGLRRRSKRSIPPRSSSGLAIAWPTTRVPRRVVPVSALPTNATGKVMKDELRAMAATLDRA